jgi:hypothetical protein
MNKKMKTYTTIDRDSLDWPAGPWDGEPDKVQWADEATRLPCLAVRNEVLGHWCGYVGVPPDHPLYGKDYSDGDARDLEAHGGITFAASCQSGDDESRGICHVPDSGEEDHVWWFGFDCAHAGDWSPTNEKHSRKRGGVFSQSGYETYKTLAYVQKECETLAEQLATG